MSTRELKFGHISGGKSSYPLPMGASEVIRGQSGRFVKPDASRRGEIAGDTHDRIMGFVEGGDETMSSTEGKSILNCIDDLTAIFRIPLRFATATYTVNFSASLIGTKHDLVVINRIQYANLTDTSEEIYIVVGGRAASAVVADGAVADRLLGDGYVDVRINPANIHVVNT